MDELGQIIQSISALEAQRATLGDSVVDTAIASLQEKLNALKAGQQSATQRKLATIVFADVSGFTSLSESVDPEFIGETMNRIWEVLDRIIVDFGGKIDKHLGDGVMALWGVPVAQENDAEMAVRAALQMVTELAALKQSNKNSELFKMINMRIGVNTGPVIFSEVGTQGELTVIGDTVNLASRLEKEAPLNGVLISHDTYRHVRGVFDVNQLPDMNIRGKSESVRVYHVLEEKEKKFHLAEQAFEDIEIELVGRDEELGFLKVKIKEAVSEDADTKVVILDGQSGIGKTRLLFDFMSWLELEDMDIYLFESRSTLNQKYLPYSTLKDIFLYRFNIQGGSQKSSAQEEFVEGIRKISSAEHTPEELEERAHFIGHLLGLDFSDSPYIEGILADPVQIRIRAYIHLSQFFYELTKTSPVLILIDNAHWADENSIDFFSYFAREYSMLPLMVLFSGRFDEEKRIKEIVQSDKNKFPYLRLERISDVSMYELVGQYLKRIEVIPDDLVSILVRNSEGNPFYLEELIRMFLEEKIIDRRSREGEKWVINIHLLNDINVPDTLTGVVQARLDRLSYEARELLQYAAVIGRVFWDQWLEVLLSQLPGKHPEDVQEHLQELLDKQLILPHKEPTFANTREFEFKNSLIKDVAYEMVLKRDRKLLHLKAAEWIVTISQNRTTEFSNEVALHYEVSENHFEAARFYAIAGKHALSRTAFEDAVHFFANGLSSLEKSTANEDSERMRAEILLENANALSSISNFSEAQSNLKKVVGSAEKHHWPGLLSDALRKLGDINRETGDYENALAMAERSIALSEQMDDYFRQAQSLSSIGMLRFRMGEIDNAKRAWESSLKFYEEADYLSGIAMCYNRLGGVARAQRDFDTAKANYLKSIELFQKIGDIQEQAKAQGNLGSLYVETEEYENAQDHIQGALTIFRQIHNQLAAGICLNNLAGLAIKMDQPELAQEQLIESIRVCHTIGATPIILASISTMVDVMVRSKKDLMRANELLHFALHHPATIAEVKRDSEALLIELKEHLSPEEFEQSKSSGEALDLEKTVALILQI